LVCVYDVALLARVLESCSFIICSSRRQTITKLLIIFLSIFVIIHVLDHLNHVFLGNILDSRYNGIILMVNLLCKNTNFRFNLLQRLFQSSGESLYSSRFYTDSYNIINKLTVFRGFQPEYCIISLFDLFDTMKSLSSLHFLFNRRPPIIKPSIYITI
jgi:hypothetical protein